MDELQFAIRAVDETHPAFPKPITEKRQNNRPAYAPSTAVIPTVAIHRGDHGTYEPAGTIIIEQHSRQQTTKQTVVRKFRFRQTETTEAMTRMKRFQRFKPAIIGRHDSIQWNGIVKTAIFEGHSRKSNLQHECPHMSCSSHTGGESIPSSISQLTKVPRSPAKEPIAERRDHNERFQRNLRRCNQFQL